MCVYVCVKLRLQHNVQITQHALHNSAAEDTNSYSSHNVHTSTADHISSLLGFTKCVRSINNSISTKGSRQSGVAIENLVTLMTDLQMCLDVPDNDVSMKC